MSASANTGSLLDVNNLSVRFASSRGPVTAVEDLSFSMKCGEVVALVGESGSGKSTTAMAVARLLPGNAVIGGSVRFKGDDLLAIHPAEMRQLRGRHIGIVFQDPYSYLNPVKTIGWQIGEVLRTHDIVQRAELKGKVIELLRLVGIKRAEERYAAYPHQFSGGMRQRAMLAMAIACRPALLIADEPTTALDVTVQDRIIGLLLELRDKFGMGILLITHNLGLVARVADRAVVLHNGLLVESAEVEKLFGAPQHPYTRKLLDAVPRSPAFDQQRRL